MNCAMNQTFNLTQYKTLVVCRREDLFLIFLYHVVVGAFICSHDWCSWKRLFTEQF